MLPPLSTATSTTTTALYEELDTDNNNQRRGPRRPSLLNVDDATVSSCNCGKLLCTYDCHFLQHELQAFEATVREASRQRVRQRRDSTASVDSEDQHQQFDEDDKAIADLECRFRRHFTNVTRSDSTSVDDIISDTDSFRFKRTSLRRTKSCGVHSEEFDQEQLQLRHNSYSLRIDGEQSERCEQHTQVVSDDSDTMSITLACRALRCRRILDNVDVMDLSLDVSD